MLSFGRLAELSWRALDEPHRWQLLDLCCALAMDGAAAMRRRLPLTNDEWIWVPEATRQALRVLANDAHYEVPKSIPTIDVGKDAQAAAIERLIPMARDIVPLHDQYEAMAAWSAALTRLESSHRLEHANLPDKAVKLLRASVYGQRDVIREITEHRESYFDHHGDRGGWAQLSMIIDQTLLLRLWQLLGQQGIDQGLLTNVINGLLPGTSLKTLDEIRSLAGPA